MGFPVGSDQKESACNVGDPDSIPGLRRSPREGMAIQSSILAWSIPWIEEPGGLLSTGSQRFGHDWATTTDIRHTKIPCVVYLKFTSKWTSWVSSGRTTSSCRFLCLSSPAHPPGAGVQVGCLQLGHEVLWMATSSSFLLPDRPDHCLHFPGSIPCLHGSFFFFAWTLTSSLPRDSGRK